MKTRDWIGLSALAAIFAVAAVNKLKAEETLHFTLGGSNAACGKFWPTAGIRYDRDSAEMPILVNLNVGPNAGCDGQGVGVDASVSRHVELNPRVYVDLTAGFQQQFVAFEYQHVARTVNLPRDEPARTNALKPSNLGYNPIFNGQVVEASTASAGLGFRLGTDWTASIGWNAVETLDENDMALKPYRVEISGSLFGVELDLVAIEKVSRAALSWEPRESVVVGVSAVHNAHKLKHPAPPDMENGQDTYVRVRPAADTVYNIHVGWEF